jgi:hypothetical protein
LPATTLGTAATRVCQAMMMPRAPQALLYRFRFISKPVDIRDG